LSGDRARGGDSDIRRRIALDVDTTPDRASPNPATGLIRLSGSAARHECARLLRLEGGRNIAERTGNGARCSGGHVGNETHVSNGRGQIAAILRRRNRCEQHQRNGRTPCVRTLSRGLPQEATDRTFGPNFGWLVIADRDPNHLSPTFRRLPAS
jgi:hypothetical protein